MTEPRVRNAPGAKEPRWAASNRGEVEGWEAVEQAEQRLEERSGQRHRARERRRKRALVARWVVRLALPLVGAAVLVGVLELEGGDLGAWSQAAAVAFLAGVFAVPALLAGWLARGEGWVHAAAWGVGTFGVQGALVFGVAFVLLDLGPR